MSNPFGKLGVKHFFGELGPSKEERISQAMEELSKRGVKHDYCPRCDTNNWNVDLLEVPANSALSPNGLPMFPGTGVTGYLSLLAVVCRNCGNSIFHSLDVLGISLR
jgi:ribosomal protein L37E